MIQAKEFEEKTDRVEKWYQTKYKEEIIPKETLENFSNSAGHNLFLPNPNQVFRLTFKLKF